jgi:glycosyltransferase involved in cell wall biosynthesis
LQNVTRESLLTIVVPVHNMAGRMEKLASWLRDAFNSNIKVILIHDQSQDDTQSEIHQLLDNFKSPLLTVCEVKVKSPGLARNAGLNLVDTPWFSFADADDFVEIANLVLLLQKTTEHQATIGIGGYISHNLVTGKEEQVIPPPGTYQELALHLALNMGLWRIIMSTKSLGEIKFSPDRMAEDYYFLLQVLNCCEIIQISESIVYKYYFGGLLNLTSDKSAMKDMLNVSRAFRRFDPSTDIARYFRIFASQKLSFSILKNVSYHKKISNVGRLVTVMVLHPVCLLNFVKAYSKAKS